MDGRIWRSIYCTAIAKLAMQSAVIKLIVRMLACAQNAVKSDDLSQVFSAADTIQHNFRNCLARGKDAVSTC